MYEIELRSIVDDFDSIKSKLDNFAKPIELEEKEVTIFFTNPHNSKFDLRLKLTKNKNILSFKESLDKTARKEIESEVSNSYSIYSLLLQSGFAVKMIVARIKYIYKYNKFDILLNKILNWGDAVEVERIVEDETDAEKIEEEIKEFINTKLGLPQLLSKEELLSRNEKYAKNIKLENIDFNKLLRYINDKEDNLFF
ncbi:CYTH domain-containing protein [Candidatus Woesearchaeota archaeon]|nr:CYTH domain-containing protein [Candidatus Woesearchaeota archaeon]